MEVHGKSALTKGQRTHERLLDATLRLIREEGLPALTTGRITAEAGLAQSSFYQHFRSLDACLAEAGRRVAERIQPASARFTERALSGFRGREDLAALIEVLVEQVVVPFLNEPELTSLYYRYQRDPSPFGHAMEEAVSRERKAIRTLWFDAADRLGIGPELYPVLALQAELVIGMSRSAIRALVDGEFHNRELVLGQLRLMIEGGIRHGLALLDASAKAADEPG